MKVVIPLVLLVIDLILKFGAAGGNDAVINYGVSGGVILSPLGLMIGYGVLLFWLLRERVYLAFFGGVANGLSRLIWGGVVDYWNFLGLFTNNLADWMIVGGLILYVFQRKTVQYTP